MTNIKIEILERFGKLLINDVYDAAIKRSNNIIEGDVKAPELIGLHTKIKKINNNKISAIKELENECIIGVLDYFLWMIEESDEFDLIICNKENEIISLKEISDGLCGELYGEDGWIKKYSKYSTTFG